MQKKRLIYFRVVFRAVLFAVLHRGKDSQKLMLVISNFPKSWQKTVRKNKTQIHQSSWKTSSTGKEEGN